MQTTIAATDVQDFVANQETRIRQLEMIVKDYEETIEEMKSDADKRLSPEYRGFEFWLTELFAGYGHEDNPNYGYVIRRVVGDGGHSVSSGGSYATKHEATKAAFARIETITFDR